MAIRAGTNTIVTFAAGTNDLGASTSANTLWTTHVQPCIAFIKSFGYQVIVETVIPRTDFDAAKETERLAYNQLLRDNAVAQGYTLCDYTTNAAFDSQADASNTTFYDPDGVHLNSTGYGVQASMLAPLVNGLLT